MEPRHTGVRQGVLKASEVSCLITGRDRRVPGWCWCLHWAQGGYCWKPLKAAGIFTLWEAGSSHRRTHAKFFGVCSLPDGEPLSTPSSYWESKHPTSFLETKERNLSCKPMPRHGLSLRACVLPTIASFSSQTSSPEFHQGGLFHLTHLGWLFLFFFFCLEMFL